MTVRDKTFAGITVHAGPPAELAALALDYAARQTGRDADTLRALYEQAAEQLGNGFANASVNNVRFWTDRPNGAPFQGPQAWRPDPDPDWARAEAARLAAR